MKNPFSFIIIHSFWNTLKRMVKKPGMLIYLIFLVGIFVTMIVSGGNSPLSQTFGNRAELVAGANILFTIIFVLNAKAGFDKGGSIFSMPDVNLMFVAPLKNQSILYYGMIRQAKVSLIAGLFILFQYSWMHTRYGINAAELIILMLFFGMALFAGQFLAMVLCSYLANNENKRNILSKFFYLIIFVYAVATVFNLFINRTNWLNSTVSFINQYGSWFPISGWISGLYGSIIGTIAPLKGVLFFIFYVLSVWLMAFLMKHGTTDYYEDVLQTTERNWSALSAQKAGRVAEIAPEKIKKGNIGFSNGVGASVFYYKQCIESRRTSFFSFSKMDLIFFGLIAVFTFFMRNESEGLYAAFGFAVYMQVFSVSLGRLSRELEKPFIYLIPEKPFTKLIYGSLENIRNQLIFSFGLAVLFFIVYHLNVLGFFRLWYAFFSFAMIFISVSVLMQRFFGAMASKGLTMFLLIVCVLLLSAPGIVLSIIISSIPAFIVMGTVNLLISILVCFLCRKVLDKAEINN